MDGDIMGEREILMVPIITIFMFLGITLGGIFSFLFRFILGMKIERTFVFCGGLLLGLILFELLPESFTQNSWMGIVLGILAGILSMSIAEKLLHKNLNVANGSLEYIRSFVLLLVAIGIHNLPTGLALGTTMKTDAFSLSPLLAALILHHIPEGMALMGAMAFVESPSVLFVISAVFLAVVLGASIFIGFLIGDNSYKLNTLLFGGAIGTLSFVTFHEILWKAKRKMKFHEFGLYVLLGLLFVYMFLLLIH